MLAGHRYGQNIRENKRERKRTASPPAPLRMERGVISEIPTYHEIRTEYACGASLWAKHKGKQEGKERR